MPFINVTRKKRDRSHSRSIWPYTSGKKLPKLFHHNVDGPASRNSLESSNTGVTQKSGMIAKMSRGGSRVRSFFSIGSRQSDTVCTPNEEDTGVVVTRQGSFASFRPMQSSTATTVVNRPRLRLTGTPDVNERDFLGDLPNAVQRDLSPNSADGSEPHIAFTNRRALRKSQSAPGLSHRLSHKFSQAFGNPTIVHRSDLRSRPSIHEIPFPIDDAAQLDDGDHIFESDPTSKRTSISLSIGKQLSTAPTSDELTNSPSSGEALKIVPTCKRTFLVVPSQDMSTRKLSTISESTLNNIPSIATVEATAAAKIFFETHFNTVMNGIRPRSIRRQELEDRLRALDLPADIQRKARRAWQVQETEHLRQERALMTRTNGTKASKGVSISGYEVVKILGKGSFGVVRLVKEKKATSTNEETVPTASTTHSSSRRPSMADLIALKESAKEVLAPLSSRRSRRLKGKKQVYAMKVIRKSEMVRNSQEGHLRAERDFLVAAEGSRWIVPLVAAFQDYHNLYLVMEYCIGGDFLGLLIRKNVLSEEVTRWYIAEMILCVEEAHRMRWIHRDVKPDNFLIGADGHLKISDFGLAFDGDWCHNQAYVHQHRQALVDKLDIELEGDDQDKEETEAEAVNAKVGSIIEKRHPSKRIADKSMPTSNLGPPEGETILDWRNREHRRKLARSVVGTSQYMAPEVIRGDLYDGRCDWWSIGIILYECLYGFTPFACENRQDTKLHILKHKTTLEFPQSVRASEAISYDALDLMMQILQEKERRLCSRKYANNDFMRKIVGGTLIRTNQSDKSHKNYQGYFVYPDDADDLKKHAFFNGINWDTMHLVRPPFVPRVKSWEDTKYFDEEDPVSDMSASSEDDDDILHVATHGITKPDGENTPLSPADMKPASKKSGHHQEDQKIVPSNPEPPGAFEGKTVNEIVAEYEKSHRVPNPLVSPAPGQYDGHVGFVNLPEAPPSSTMVPQDEIIMDAERVPDEDTSKKKKPREKKRPRDKILRDAVTGKVAMKMRKQGAFLGYEYRKGKGVDDVLGRDELASKLPGKRKSLVEMKRSGGAYQERLMGMLGERAG